MRWRYPDPADREEASARAAVLGRIDAWWAAFEVETGEIRKHFRRQSDLDLPAWMHDHLGRIDDRLMWESGPGLRGGNRLVITPEAEHHLHPLVAALLARAPRLEGWEFYPGRLPEGEAEAIAMVRARCGRDIPGATVRARAGAHNKVNLCYQIPESAGTGRKAEGEAFVATECLLGEAVMDRWIGLIETMPPAREGWLSRLLGRHRDEPREFAPLSALRGNVESVRAKIVGALPDVPRFRLPPEGPGTPISRVYKIERAPPRAEYAGRTDVFAASSMYPAMWEATRSGLFASERFSRCGETFCYIKLDGLEGLAATRFSDRSAIQDALDEALAPAGIGCTLGGATGERYSYIDLALTDVPRAIESIRGVLRRGKVANRSWLLFLDDDLADEWIGVWDDTPPPPREPRSPPRAPA